MQILKMQKSENAPNKVDPNISLFSLFKGKRKFGAECI